MKFYFGLIVIIILLGCSKPDTVDSNSVDDVTDSLTYVGYIQKFDDNNTFYIDLNFVNNFDYNDYEKVADLGDLEIFKDEETKRTRLPLVKAGEYFDLTGLDQIEIFSKNCKKIATGKLSHIEYIEDFIESRFVGAYEVDNPNISDYMFCMSGSNDLTTLSYSEVDDVQLKSTLVHALNLNLDRIWNTLSYKFNDSGNIYTAISADTTAFIVETIADQQKILYRSKASEVINSLVIISKEINAHPILLINSAMPETDMTWTSVLTFNGSEYLASEGWRIRK